MSEHVLASARAESGQGAAIQDSRGFSNNGLRRGAGDGPSAPSRNTTQAALTTTAIQFFLDPSLLNTGDGRGKPQRIKLDGGAVAIRVSRRALVDTDNNGPYDLVAANASGEFPVSDVASLWIRADSGSTVLAYTIYYT